MLEAAIRVTRVLDFETDEDAHFECPQCGQKGSVPKVTLEKALAETPHVYISCSSCAHKFEPFASLHQMDGDQTDELEAAPSPNAPLISPLAAPLEEHWARHDDAEDGDTDTGEAEGHLPGWMLPVEKPQEDAPEAEAAPAPDKNMADDIADNIPDDISDEIGEETPTAEDDPQPIAPVAPPPAEEAPEDAPEAPVEEAPQYAASPYAEVSPANGPTGLLNRVLSGLVLVSLAIGAFVFFSNRNAPPSSSIPATASTSAVAVENAGFVRFTEDGEAGVEVSIRFTNPSAQIGIIGDFRIELQNEARERLVQWTILGTGETVAPGQSRTLTSVLFGPPKGLAHVNIVYPLDE